MEWLLTIFTVVFVSLEFIVAFLGHCLALETSVSVLNVLFMTILCHGSIVCIISEYFKGTPECMITFVLQDTALEDRNFRVGEIGTNLCRSNNVVPEMIA